MPLLWLSLAFLMGILTANLVALPASTWLILAGVSFGLSLAQAALKRLNIRTFQRFRLTGPPLPIPILLLIFCLGGARYRSALPNLTDPGFIAASNDTGRQMVVTGLVVEMPDERDTYTNLRVEAEVIRPRFEEKPNPVSGTLLARVDPEAQVRYGDRVALTGYLETPPEAEDFSYREYLARQGVYAYVPRARVEVLETGQGNGFMRAIYALKRRALGVVYELWPDPEASLFAGILLGVETGIPEPIQKAFKETGTTHIIAISGFNIAIISGLFAQQFGKILGARRGAVAAVIAIGVYTILVGADAAVVRAAIMGGLSLFARQMGRRQTGVNTLAFVAALMSLFNPHTPWDVGFQLSFAATLGLILYADPMARGFVALARRAMPEKTAKKLAGPVGEYFLFTIAAQITTLPIMAYHFGAISWSAFLANPVILPVQPPIMTVGGLALILGVIWLPLGRVAAPLAWPFVLFTIRVVEFFGRYARGTLVLGDLGILWVVLFYAALLCGTFGWQRFRGWISARRERVQAAATIPVLGLAGILAVIVWRVALAAPDGRLHLTLLDVGTGDAILVQSPGGGYLLIDGGPSPSLLSDGLGRRMPPFHREIDWLVVASPRKEQIAALPRVIERFPPGEVLWAGPESPSRDADYVRECLTSLQIPVSLALRGQTFDLGSGANLRVAESGERGAILLLEWDRFRALLPLGLSDGNAESLRMGKDLGPVTVLLLADNGHQATNPPEWIGNLRPQLVLLSVAPDDRNGLPHREVLDALGGYSLLRTDRNGWIRISTDGKQMWVEVER